MSFVLRFKFLKPAEYETYFVYSLARQFDWALFLFVLDKFEQLHPTPIDQDRSCVVRYLYPDLAVTRVWRPFWLLTQFKQVVEAVFRQGVLRIRSWKLLAALIDNCDKTLLVIFLTLVVDGVWQETVYYEVYALDIQVLRRFEHFRWNLGLLKLCCIKLESRYEFALCKSPNHLFERPLLLVCIDLNLVSFG